ncbi:MAG: hypothetical protein WBP79_08290 [Candidatus Acidiferrales bacterium]
MSPRAEDREVDVYDSDGHLVLDVWIMKGQIDHMELFKHVD